MPLDLIGVGGSLTKAAVTIAVINSPPEGLASCAFNTGRQIGSLIRVAVFGTIVVQIMQE